ncbi:MAG TPA: hypothetical protein VFB50_00525 [Chloroflexota bacterium]|nr:hypothetical protein [Chloroflexota bacterium]
MAETKVTSQTGNQVQMPTPNKEVMNAVRASKPGLPYTGAPGHKMPR